MRGKFHATTIQQNTKPKGNDVFCLSVILNHILVNLSSQNKCDIDRK
jgi:hypothetical protein